MSTNAGMTNEALALATLRRMLRSGEAKRIREKAELTQSEIARTLGTTSGAVCHWEALARVPRGELALAYLDLLLKLEALQEAS